ncbi:anaerobic nitric oxide reductase transcription regulator [Modicisalibacter muralis]|uniref:Anaerobic nitric oxide reductase transcription regulator n=1 Tax=Modicisalibacter muralis TaxID=119000 RepID=A0A1G9QRU8_9GAMM|nr:nitric oxide reductase transcriptional regulator NorR [Halomonas muralis]SDM12995.1 anaerobic nitric oxide reductase transcription regulator [Halomonas muralis]
MIGLESALLADLTTELPSAVRLQRLVCMLREYFHCGAVGLLRLDDDALSPVAVDGLTREALGRRFVVAQHPRLATILASRETVAFPPDSTLPDPYDGLVENHVGEPLPVHDCMGISLYIQGSLWGALTLDALRAGTFDDDARDDLQRFTLLVEAAVRMTRLEQDIRGLRLVRSDEMGEIATSRDEGEIIGQSAPIRRLLDEIEVVADSELPVLLTGETGVGKELFARRLHQRSRRRRKPLIQVNCAALPESLAESELFGHVKGAFSGAGNARAGRFEAADGGTLFLDEIGELPLSVQAKLLRALQNGEIQRLGEDVPRHVDVRIITATNRQLRDSVRDGHFRADLYHRLSVYPVPIPPLRERGSDVLVLAGHFLELNRTRLGLRSLRLSPAAEEVLCRYDWPGNVRELEHVISRGAIKALSRGAQREDIVTLEPELLDLPFTPRGIEITEEVSYQQPMETLHNSVARAQRAAIRQALAQAEDNWAAAARMLSVDPSNLHKLAHRLGLKSESRHDS